MSVIIDSGYPTSQPRVQVSVLKEGSWPHVEDHGLLCLRQTRIGADAGERVAQHIAWAVELLNLDAEARSREFQREFATYWERSADGKRAPEHTWINELVPGSREVAYYVDAPGGRVVWASERGDLRSWLQNSGLSPSDREFNRSWLEWFDDPPAPALFPRTGADVLGHIPRDFLAEVVRPGAHMPVLYGATTETGPVLVAIELATASEKELLKGFRPSHLPSSRVVQSMTPRSVRRFPVRRADASYVHGRDHNAQLEQLAAKKIVLVGCGSLGGFIARLLAQAGVRLLTFIDDDRLRAHNTSRHVLGARFVGKFKADAMAAMLREDFPHGQPAVAVRQRIESFAHDRLEKLLSCDLIVSSGISFLGDNALNSWRLSKEAAPPHLCCWVEPFALAGHAVAVMRHDDLLQAFDPNGYPVDALTDWPEEAQVMIAEAGCGNNFQPHGAVELQRTALVASRLVLDILLGVTTESCRRAWQGERNEVVRLGGAPSAVFEQSNVETTRGWFEREAQQKGAPA